MSSLNKVMLIGNLGSDPEMKSTPGGVQVAQLSIATSESFTDKNGQRRENTEWHRVVLWDKTAELAGRFLRKGSKVYVEGQLKTRSWDDQATGQKRYATEVVGRQLTFLDSRPQDGSQGHDRAPAAPSAGNRPQPRQNAPQGTASPGGDPGHFDDDIPF